MVEDSEEQNISSDQDTPRVINRVVAQVVTVYALNVVTKNDIRDTSPAISANAQNVGH